MYSRITITSLFVLDQDEALDFYVGKLGLEVHTDLDLGFMRWLTVCVPGDRSREILLERPGPPAMDEATAALDEENQDAMMEMLRDELPDTAVVSIGHRPGLERHHDRVLVLEPSPEGAVLAAPEAHGGGGAAAAVRDGGRRPRRLHRRGAPAGGGARRAGGARGRGVRLDGRALRGAGAGARRRG